MNGKDFCGSHKRDYIIVGREVDKLKKGTAVPKCMSTCLSGTQPVV